MRPARALLAVAVAACPAVVAPAAQAPDDPASQDVLERLPAELPRADPGRWSELFEAEGGDVDFEHLPEGVAEPMREAGVAYREDDYPEALRWLYEVLEAEPDFPPALLEAGTTYFRLRRYGDAQVLLERFCEVAPGQVWRTQALGHCYYSLGDYERALEHYQRVVEVFGDSAEAVRGLALSHYRLGRSERALELLDRVLELRTDHFEALAWQAQIQFEEGRLEEALTAAERARDLDPYEPRPWYLLSQILFDLEREEEADEALERWSELDRFVQEIRVIEAQLLYRPDDYGLALRLAQLQQEVGNVPATRGALALMLRNRPPDVSELDLRIFVLDTLWGMQDFEGAEVAAQALEETCADEPEAWKRLERYYALTRNTMKRVQAGERYLRLQDG